MPRPIRNKINQRIRDRLRAAAIEKGGKPSDVDAILDDMEEDRPFLDWLLNGGFEKVLELIMNLLLLFVEPQPE